MNFIDQLSYLFFSHHILIPIAVDVILGCVKKSTWNILFSKINEKYMYVEERRKKKSRISGLINHIYLLQVCDLPLTTPELQLS